MAREEKGIDITVNASGDLSTKQYYFVDVNSSGLAAVVAAAGARAVGVLQNKPDASGRAGTVRIFGVTKVIAGGSITAGDSIASDANGKAGAVTKGKVNTSDAGASADPVIGSYVMGVALADAASGDIFPVMLYPVGVVPTTAA